MRENCGVGCEQEGCSRQGEPERRMTGDQSPKVSILHKKEFFSHPNRNRESEKKSIQRDMMKGMVTGYHIDNTFRFLG